MRGETSAGTSSAPAPTTGIDPYADLHNRALTVLGSGGARVVPMSVTRLEEETPRPVEGEAARRPGGPGY